MEKDTTNEKDPRVTSTGPSEKNTTNTPDSTGASPAQVELTFEFKPAAPATKKRKYNLKTTVNEAQYEQIDSLFDYAGKQISTLDFRKNGVLHPAGRIKEMNEKHGYYIPTVDRRTVIDEQGYPHPRIAFYELIERPKKAA